MDLLKMIEDAETKGELEAIGKKHLGTDVDKRKGIETIRAELEELAAEGAREEPQAAEPAAEAKPEPAPAKPKGKGETRLLKNTKNGRVVPYTAALAKVRHMKEV